MSGASSRRRGHQWEVDCANLLADVTGLEIVTTRSLGASYGADLATVLGHDARGRPVRHEPSVMGWSVECKYWKRRLPGQWLEQAEMQSAPDLIPVVLSKVKYRGIRDGRAYLRCDESKRGWRDVSIEEWLEDAFIPARTLNTD